MSLNTDKEVSNAFLWVLEMICQLHTFMFLYRYET